MAWLSLTYGLVTILVHALTSATTLENKMKNAILATIFTIFCGLLSTAVHATTLNSSPYMLVAKNNQALNNAAQSIKQQTGGRILSTKTISKDGKVAYKIKVLLPSGKVQIFTVNAK